MQDADVYSAKNFNAFFISYAEDNAACKNDINSKDCPSVKLPQAVNDYLNSYLALIANNVLLSSKDENLNYGTVEFDVSVTVVGPVPYAAYKKTYELSPNQDVFIALAEANKFALMKFGVSIADIESPIYGSDKPLKLRDARDNWGRTYVRSITEWVAKTGRNRVYTDYPMIMGGSIPPIVFRKLGDPFSEAIVSWLTGIQ